MSLTKDDLQAIAGLFAPIEARMEAGFTEISERLGKVEGRLDSVEQDNFASQRKSGRQFPSQLNTVHLLSQHLVTDLFQERVASTVVHKASLLLQ